MKRIALLGLLMALSSTAFGFTETREINQSSFTNTNDTKQWIQQSSQTFPFIMSNTGPNTDFRGVVIASPTTGGTVIVFDSQGVVTSTIATISCANANEFHYNIRLSSGLTYTSNNCTNGATILFHIN